MLGKKKFKFKLLDKVVHASTGKFGFNEKLLIVARYFEEKVSGIEEIYVVSFHNGVQVVRQAMHVEEIMTAKEEKTK